MNTIYKNGTEEKTILENCCEEKGVKLNEIEALLEAENEFKVKSKRRGITLRLKQIVKDIVSEEEKNK